MEILDIAQYDLSMTLVLSITMIPVIISTCFALQKISHTVNTYVHSYIVLTNFMSLHDFCKMSFGVKSRLAKSLGKLSNFKFGLTSSVGAVKSVCDADVKQTVGSWAWKVNENCPCCVSDNRSVRRCTLCGKIGPETSRVWISWIWCPMIWRIQPDLIWK